MKSFLIICLATLACATPDSAAEAEAEAKPWSSYPYGYRSMGYPYKPYHGYRAAVPFTYGAHPSYRPPHYLGKREAEAEAAAIPEAEANPEAAADAWLTYGYGHPYAYAGHGLHYTHHNVFPAVKKEAKVEVKPVETKAVTYTHPYGLYPYGVHHPVAYAPYAHHFVRGKREAEAAPEAEADPWVTYGTYGAYNPYNTL